MQAFVCPCSDDDTAADFEDLFVFLDQIFVNAFVVAANGAGFVGFGHCHLALVDYAPLLLLD